MDNKKSNLKPKPFSLFHDSEKGILFVNLNGDIVINDIINSIQAALLFYPDIPDNFKILADASEAHMKFKYSDVWVVFSKALALVKDFNKITNAFVVNKTKETAYSFIAKSLSFNTKVNFEVFSNISEAELWLDKH